MTRRSLNSSARRRVGGRETVSERSIHRSSAARAAQDRVPLVGYFTFLRQQSPLLLVAIAIGLLLATGWHVIRPPVYEARASVLVGESPLDKDPPLGLPAQPPSMDTEARVLTSTAVGARVARAADLPNARVAIEQLQVSVPPNTRILEVTFQHERADAAARGANAAVAAYLDLRRKVIVERRAEVIAQRKEYAWMLREDRIALEEELADPSLAAEERGVGLRLRDSLLRAIILVRSQKAYVRRLPVDPGQRVQTAVAPTSTSGPDPFMPLVSGTAVSLLLGLGAARFRMTQARMQHPADPPIPFPPERVVPLRL